MRTVDKNPPISFSQSTGEPCLTHDDWQLPWHVAYCKPRQEKSVARDLMKLGVPYFLPMVERHTTSGGRRHKSLCPLFASYIFFGADEDQRVEALRTNRILHFLPTNDAEQDVLKQELNSLEACLLSAPKEVELYNHLVKGQQVRVTAGAMRDWEGVVLDATRPHKIWVGVSTLGGGIVVEVHADMLAAY